MSFSKFQSMHPLRGATSRNLEKPRIIVISIHAPLAGCDRGGSMTALTRLISIHAPLAGCDIRLRSGGRLAANFNPCTPCGVRPAQAAGRRWMEDFNPCTPCGVRPTATTIANIICQISIHAPLAGCDRRRVHTLPRSTNFNPCTPCGVRPSVARRRGEQNGFQSMHPLRGATGRRGGKEDHQAISIHAPLAGCDRPMPSAGRSIWNFNPCTPCGVRLCVFSDFISRTRFQSMHPLRGATDRAAEAQAQRDISIHAPLAGCDRDGYHADGRRGNFNPCTPCGVRQQNCRNIPGKFAQKLQNFCKAEQRAALLRVGQRESGRYFRPCAVRTSRGKPERFRFASDNERALRSVARLCAEVLDAGFILVSKVIKA